jgi:hypothetical protein
MIVIPERSFDITVKLQYYVTYFRVSRFASNPSALADSNELIFYYKPRASSLQIEYVAEQTAEDRIVSTAHVSMTMSG